MKNIEREPKTVLVTGGSGFIGNLTCRLLVQAGHNVINVDRKKCEIPGVHQYPFDIDNHQLKGILQLTKPDTIIHLAATHQVTESFIDPAGYYTNNVANTINLLNHAVAAGVKNFIFSSSSSIYGGTNGNPNKETDPMLPISPYARSKTMIEMILKDYEQAYSNMKFVSLRYFNAAGADPDSQCGYTQDPPGHLVPIVVQRALADETVPVFGTDYPTKDGTAERDYTHVYDIARAHINAMNYLDDGNESAAFNLGAGKPYSVKEVINAVEKETGKTISMFLENARQGDPAKTWADISKAKEVLGWEPVYGLEDIVAHAVAWEKKRKK
jgi:UDP-glucose 4-epimerase